MLDLARPPLCILRPLCMLLWPAFLADVDAPEDVQVFWRTVDKAIKIEASGGGHFLDLESANWLGMDESLIHVMYVRDCYPELWDFINSDSSKRRFGIIGKPYLLIFFTWRI